MNLDKELLELARLELNLKEQQKQKQIIKERYQRSRTALLWVQGAVMTCICGLFLILFLQTDHEYSPQTQQAILSDELKEVTILYNKVSERHLNLNSPMYISKRSTTDQAVLNAFHSLVTAENIKVEHISGHNLFPEYSNVYDILLKFENGQQLYLKYSSNFLFNPKNNILYEFSTETNSEFNQIIQSLYSGSEHKWKIYALLFFGVLMLLEYHFIGKKLYNKDEDGKYRTRPALVNTMIFMIFYIPLFCGSDWIGAMHVGLVLLGLILSFMLGEYYDVKKGIKQPNWVWSVITLIYVILLLFIIIL